MKNEKEFRTVRGYQMLNAKKELLTSSMEDYLEMIYRICMDEGYIRMNHLAEKLNVRPSSATKIVQKLNVLGVVDYHRYGIIRLTVEGKEIGEFLMKRHGVIEEFLKKIGLEESLLKETEMIEHDVSVNTLRNIYILNQFLNANPEVEERFRLYKEKFQGEPF